ncbi:MAG TPA: 2-amino-4-hydroxy-6-hydroxymethyldihydropteridine diphosphokinase [Verrucomicrobiae bacterium]|nr:2-amino-4-hydroxy-6-hydroxymethyldihydropteridine diphosphokinase [Verrucomicrobiae bacterium]
MTDAVLSLGSNLAPREGWLDLGLASLVEEGVRLTAVGPRWHTRALGGPAQPDFLDIVVRGVAELAPAGWLALARRAEARAGRRRPVPKGPRTLDVDVLAIGELVVDTEDLRLPHPAVLCRPYLLRGLALVAPSWRHPRDGRSYLELARAAEPLSPRSSSVGSDPSPGPVRTEAGPPGRGSAAGSPPPGG